MDSMQKLTTKLGDVYVGINNNYSVYFQTKPYSNQPNNFTVNGVEYKCDGHMVKDSDGWKITSSFSCVKVNSVKYNDYTRSAWNKAHTEIFNAITEWLGKSEIVDILNSAQIEYNQMRRDRMLEKIKTAEKELDALRDEYALMP